VNSFMSWIGGKKALRDEILARFPLNYKRYVEVFGGGGWVLFHKLPGQDFEVYNDFNPNLANLYRCVLHHPTELIEELTHALNSRLEFDSIRKTLHTKSSVINNITSSYLKMRRLFYAKKQKEKAQQ
jgi:DNA adenine methylase